MVITIFYYYYYYVITFYDNFFNKQCLDIDKLKQICKYLKQSKKQKLPCSCRQVQVKNKTTLTLHNLCSYHACSLVNTILYVHVYKFTWVEKKIMYI